MLLKNRKMKCVKCESTKFKTLDTRTKFHWSMSQISKHFAKDNQAVYRRKQCVKCLYIFFTKEFFLEGYLKEKIKPKLKTKHETYKKLAPKIYSKKRPIPKSRNQINTYDEEFGLDIKEDLREIGEELGIDFDK